jgi:hypothetical protein
MLLFKKAKFVLIVLLALTPLMATTAFCQSFAAGFGTGNVLPFSYQTVPENGLNSYAMKVRIKQRNHKPHHSQ